MLLNSPVTHRCRSSVVEHPLGKGEVVSSILPGSTNKMGASANLPLQNRAEQNKKMHENTHQIRTKCSRKVHGLNRLGPTMVGPRHMTIHVGAAISQTMEIDRLPKAPTVLQVASRLPGAQQYLKVSTCVSSRVIVTSDRRRHKIVSRRVRSLVAHLVRDEGVAGSNPATPTNT
jgi:hypothetical protein